MKRIRTVLFFLLCTFYFALCTLFLNADVPVMSSGTAQIRMSVYDCGGSTVSAGTQLIEKFSISQSAVSSMTAAGQTLYQGFWGQDFAIPPEVTNLSVSTTSTINELRLAWPAPYNDDIPAPGTLDITSGYFRVKVATYTPYNYAASDYTNEVSTALAAGATQTYSLSGLTLGVTYYIRVWHSDENFNWSSFSSGATIYLPDVPINPDAPLSLAQSAGSPEAALSLGAWTSDNTLKLSFGQSDPNLPDSLRFIVDVSSYPDFSIVYHSSISIYYAQGTTAYTTAPLPDSASWYWRVRSQDNSSGNYFSAYSTAASGGAAFRIDTTAPGAVSDLAAQAGNSDGEIILNWTSPSDNGLSEPLLDAVYRIKAATYNITTADFDGITHNPDYTYYHTISTTSLPSGTAQVYTATGLYPGTTYYFAVKTIDKAGNQSYWSISGVNAGNRAPAKDVPPAAPPGVVARPAGTTTIDVSWDLPQINGYDDRDKYQVLRATFAFSLSAEAVIISTKTHPLASHTDSGVSANTTYYYRVRTLDKGYSGAELASNVLLSELSVIASTKPAVSQQLKVTVVYDDRSENNSNNYGIIDGIEDADGTITFIWPKVVGGGVIQNYYIEVSSSLAFGFYSSSATISSSVSTHTVSGLSKGYTHYARVKARNTDADESPWCYSDGIYVNRKKIDGDSSDWTGNYSAAVNSVTVSNGDALWRDAVSDHRGDRYSSSQLDISSVGITTDQYNLYLFIAFASTVSAGFDGRNLVQIALDNDYTSTERVFRGRNVSYEDSYVSSDVPWEWLMGAVSGNDHFRAEDSWFANRRYGKYSENNTDFYYELAMPFSSLGGSEKFLNKTVNISIATFWNAGGDLGSIGDWDSGGTTSNAVDVVSSSGITWNEIGDRSLDYYLAVSIDGAGSVTSAEGKATNFTFLPPEPQPDTSAPPGALNYILYNIFIDGFNNGDPTNDDTNDTNDYGGDFQGVIDKVGYLNDLGINMAYFGPPYKFGGGIWGFNIDDPFDYNPKFGGTSKYIEMVKKLHNHNILVMNDWVCGQVGGTGSPAAVRNPDYYWPELFGNGTKQEFAEPRAYYLNNMIWAFATCDAFRYDNPKFWDQNGFGREAYEYNRALRKISDRWDPELFIMGEIPEDVGAVNDFTGNLGAMLHGGEDMRAGGYKDNRSAHICSWVRPGSDSQSTLTARDGIESQQASWKNNLSINPVMMENHDEKRFISRGRALPENAPWHQQVGYMTAITVGVSPILFYGGEVGLEGPYDGTSSAKMDRGGNVREMPFDRVNYSPWSSVSSSIRRSIQARANFNSIKSDPKKGGRGWYTGGQYDGEVLVYAKTWGSDKSIMMMNRSAWGVTLYSVPTGDNNTTYKDFLTDETFTTDGSGNIGSITIGGHYGRILIKGGYDWANVTGYVRDTANNPIVGAIVDIDQKSHWTTTTDANGYYEISGNMKKVLFGSRTFRVWAKGYTMSSRTLTISAADNDVSFTNVSGFPLTADSNPPAAPATLSGNPRNKAAMLFWQKNTEDDFQTYLIYRSQEPIPDGSNPFPIYEIFKPFYYDSDLDNKLTNGTTYYYRIRAVDRSGNRSQLSNQIAICPRAVKVRFWLDTRGYVGTVNSAQIAGGALAFSSEYYGKVALNSNGDGTYEREFDFDDTTFLEYKYIINDSVWEDFGSEKNRGELMDDSIPDIEIVDQGGGRMVIADVWQSTADESPRAPSGMQITAGPNVLTVGWTKNAEPDLSYYTLQRALNSGFSSGLTTVYVDKDKTSFIDSGLANGTAYYYRLYAVDRVNNTSGVSSTVSGTPTAGDVTPPGAPSGVAVSAYGVSGLSGIKISWDANFEGDLAGYNIYRSTTSGFTPQSSNKLNEVLISPQEAPFYTDENTVSGVQYYYKVIAMDDTSNSSNASTQLGARIVPVTFSVDMGAMAVYTVQIYGNSFPLSLMTEQALSNVTLSTWSVTVGLISGTTLWYQYGYNSGSARESDFTTSSKYREYVVPYSTASVANNWEENPAVIGDVRAYGGVGSVYLTWTENTINEDLAGYNIYKSLPGVNNPNIKVNSSPVSYSWPYKVTGLSENTYYFAVKAVDSTTSVLESTAAITVSATVKAPVYVHFGLPYAAGQSTAPYGDSSRIKAYVSVQISSTSAVWGTASAAFITNGKQELTASGDGSYRTAVAMGKGEYYNFIFFTEATGNPPNGLKSYNEYFDTVPNTGTFICSTSPTAVTLPSDVVARYASIGTNNDARRYLYLPSSLTTGTTIYVYCNFGSTPTAPTYIQAVPGNQSVTLYWSAPYGSPWTRVVDNVPSGAGEAMKAADVVAGGQYKIYYKISDPGDFTGYIETATVRGDVFSHTFTGLTNGTRYYYLMRSYDAFGGLIGNNYSVLSSTVSTVPTAAHIVTKIRVNRGADPVWKAVRKTVAFQEGVTVASWDYEGQSNMTPGGTAVNMIAPEDDSTEQEWTVNLKTGTTYNFLLFAYSTFSLTGLTANATYYDTVPNTGAGGMVTSTSLVNITNAARAFCGGVGPSFDARRMLYIPDSLSSGSTLYVFCNFASSPTTTQVSADVLGKDSLRISWAPYGSWGAGGESNKALDVVAGGSYRVYRSSVSAGGPYLLWLSTTSMSWTDTGKTTSGDGLGLDTDRTYYYVVVSSDAYSGDFIPSAYRYGAPEFSSSDAYATPKDVIPTYFKVDYIDYDRKRSDIFLE